MDIYNIWVTTGFLWKYKNQRYWITTIGKDLQQRWKSHELIHKMEFGKRGNKQSRSVNGRLENTSVTGWPSLVEMSMDDDDDDDDGGGCGDNNDNKYIVS
jgi:hypothetical protein